MVCSITSLCSLRVSGSLSLRLDLVMRLSASAMEDEATVNPDEDGFLRWWPLNRLDPSDRRRPLEPELLRRPLPPRLSDLEPIKMIHFFTIGFFNNTHRKRQKYVIGQTNMMITVVRELYLWISNTLSVYSSSSMSTNNG